MSAFVTVTRNILWNINFYTDFFKLFHDSIAVVNSISSKYYLEFLTYDFYHMLAKFEQNRMIRTTQNIWIFYIFKKLKTKLDNYVNNSDLSLVPFWNRFCMWNTHKASIFHYSKNYGSLPLQIKFKLKLTWTISHIFFETVRILKLDNFFILTLMLFIFVESNCREDETTTGHYYRYLWPRIPSCVTTIMFKLRASKDGHILLNSSQADSSDFVEIGKKNSWYCFMIL